jgi:hypothetical protein
MPAGVLLLVLSTIAAACGGDDEELTLEEFFQQGDAIDDDYGERFDRLSDEYPDPDPESFYEDKPFFGEFAVLFREFIDELETLNPPPEAEDAFAELLTTGSELGEVLQELGDRLEGVESWAEASIVLDEGAAESRAADERYWDACHSVRELADANDIVASFDCGILGDRPMPRPGSARTP